MKRRWSRVLLTVLALGGLWLCAREMKRSWGETGARISGVETREISHETDVLSVATWNVRCENGDTEAKRRWENRLLPMMRGIRAMQPDLFAVQEALHGQVADVWASMPGYGFVGVGRDDGKMAGEYTGIFWRKSRFELDESEVWTRWFSDTPEVAGSATWGNRFPRVLVQMRLRDRVTRKAFYVYATHWDHQSREVQLRSGEKMAEWMAARKFPDEPVLILGDFNATTRSASLAKLLENARDTRGQKMLRDAFLTKQPNAPARTTLHFWKGARAGTLDVDHVLVSREFEISRAEIREFREPLPSDHFPVWAELRLAR